MNNFSPNVESAKCRELQLPNVVILKKYVAVTASSLKYRILPRVGHLPESFKITGSCTIGAILRMYMRNLAVALNISTVKSHWFMEIHPEFN